MSVSLRFHLFQRKDNRVIKECLKDMFKEETTNMHLKEPMKNRQLTIHEIDTLSKHLAYRKGSRSMHGSLMDELFDDYDLGEFSLEETLRVPDLTSASDSTSDSDTDAVSMISSTASSIIRDDFVSFAKSLRYRQCGDNVNSDYSLASQSSISTFD
ncbi:hypothetical protein K7432_001643 [Basidiobolus ranarum]|uniref:Uncharacterized protein n=1 Tax=Basidiobolus ranarum TaxID=34480 RepID=A0ABR2W9E6_9FUNG